MARSVPYPKPGPMGGRLIREVIRSLKDAGLKLPLTSDILIATSGGADSTALAHLLARYGRRVADPLQIKLLHINHGWRGEASDLDARFVFELAHKLGVAFEEQAVRKPAKGESWEEAARIARKQVFAETAAEHGGIPILTAHQANDLAETVLWRLFTGAARTHGGGISLKEGAEIRPFLRVIRGDLLEYLREEKQDFREDSTNADPRFLRARIRHELMPVVEKIFPQAVRHLSELALEAQERKREVEAPEILQILQDTGIRLRRPHIQAFREKSEDPRWKGELSLPGGWVLKR